MIDPIDGTSNYVRWCSRVGHTIRPGGATARWSWAWSPRPRLQPPLAGGRRLRGLHWLLARNRRSGPPSLPWPYARGRLPVPPAAVRAAGAGHPGSRFLQSHGPGVAYVATATSGPDCLVAEAQWTSCANPSLTSTTWSRAPIVTQVVGASTSLAAGWTVRTQRPGEQRHLHDAALEVARVRTAPTYPAEAFECRRRARPPPPPPGPVFGILSGTANARHLPVEVPGVRRTAAERQTPD
ncbi:hypothetical protein QJS66_23080 [Kocuria rhizophila]|nr:hypothetical protein QJS66_23080 [Kocuria rhizophila]